MPEPLNISVDQDLLNILKTPCFHIIRLRWLSYIYFISVFDK
jgi:hypothetical protein